jgi:hypothetical protein
MDQLSVRLCAAKGDVEAGTGFDCGVHRQLSQKEESQVRDPWKVTMMLSCLFLFEKNANRETLNQDSIQLLIWNTMCLTKQNTHASSNWLTRAPLQMQIIESKAHTCAKQAQKNSLFLMMLVLFVN